VGVITDLGYVPQLVKQHALGCHCLVLESNHDLDMLKTGPYPWVVKQRVMSRHGHLSNNATAGFLIDDYDGSAEVMVLAHLSEKNNHPGLVMHSANQAFESGAGAAPRNCTWPTRPNPPKFSSSNPQIAQMPQIKKPK